jgi:hypothetical protein
MAGTGRTRSAGSLPDSASPLAGLVASHSAEVAITADIGTAKPARTRDFALDDAQRSLVESLRRAATDVTRAQLLLLAMLVDKDLGLRAQQRTLLAEAYGTQAAQLADGYHEQIQKLPPGACQPLADVAMPALRRLPRAARDGLMRTAHLLIAADGRVTVREFLLFSILKRRLGPEAERAVPVRYASLAPVAADVALVLSLVAATRQPERAEHAFNAGVVQLRQIELTFVDIASVQLDAVSAALDRLNQLAPLVKPQLIKAATAVAFVDGETNWQAASALRMVCAALDAPLPPQVVEIESA